MGCVLLVTFSITSTNGILGIAVSSGIFNFSDINECDTRRGLCTNGICRNVEGSFLCTCNDGYILSPNSEQCIDYNECISIPGICNNGRCTNTEGSFRCSCPNGFVLTDSGQACKGRFTLKQIMNFDENSTTLMNCVQKLITTV